MPKGAVPDDDDDIESTSAENEFENLKIWNREESSSRTMSNLSDYFL
jgi:hypothetical protein